MTCVRTYLLVRAYNMQSTGWEVVAGRVFLIRVDHVELLDDLLVRISNNRICDLVTILSKLSTLCIV